MFSTRVSMNERSFNACCSMPLLDYSSKTTSEAVRRREPRLSASLPRMEVTRVDVVEVAKFERNLRHGRRNELKVALDRNSEGDSGSRA
jgi:hypothetical protein